MSDLMIFKPPGIFMFRFTFDRLINKSRSWKNWIRRWARSGQSSSYCRSHWRRNPQSWAQYSGRLRPSVPLGRGRLGWERDPILWLRIRRERREEDTLAKSTHAKFTWNSFSMTHVFHWNFMWIHLHINFTRKIYISHEIHKKIFISISLLLLM